MKEDILVDDVNFAVTVNLNFALKHIDRHWQREFPNRKPTSMRMWIDAICINQSDEQEQSEQVQLMGSIFSSAELVLGWLGSDDERVPLALETLKILTSEFSDANWNYEKLCELEWLKRHPSLFKDDLTLPGDIKNKRWAALEYFCNLPYWRRVWILQELLLSPTLIYACPSASMDFHTVQFACGVLSELQTKLRQRYARKPDFMSDLTWLVLASPTGLAVFNLGPLSIISMFKAMLVPKVFERRKKKSEKRVVMAVLGATLQATDPKDHIYGILALSGLKIKPNYSEQKKTSDVLIEFASVVMEKLRRMGKPSLFFLPDAGIGVFQNPLDLPSWIPNYPEKSKGTPRPSFVGRCSRGVFPRSCPAARICGSVLSVTGMCLQVLSRLGESPTLESLTSGATKPWVEDFINRNPEYITGIPSLQAIFRLAMRSLDYKFDSSTLLLANEFSTQLGLAFGVADVPTSGAEAMIAMQQIIIAIFFSQCEIANAQLVSTFRELGIPHSAEAFVHLLRSSKLELFAALLLNRETRIFETDQGYLGLGPKGAVEGDVICNFHEYNSLVLLRKCGSSYNFVGSCFVLGLMEGEAKVLLQEGKTKVELFSIV